MTPAVPAVFDVVVIGGGPAGATAAAELARGGRRVALLDRAGRIKPCGGAIPPRLLQDFAIPESLLVARAGSARIVSPSQRAVDMPIENGFVGLVDREHFDEWLRERAASVGAQRIEGEYAASDTGADGMVSIRYRTRGGAEELTLRARAVIGADGAHSRVARDRVPQAPEPKSVFAYHEIIASPPEFASGAAGRCCAVHYEGRLSPDFYAWIFPHGATTSVGVGSAVRGFSLRAAVSRLRADSGLEGAQTLRREGAPIPLKPRSRWDNGADTVLAGDAAGTVAPASGEGIYYGMASGQMAAHAVAEFLRSGNPRALRAARRRFLRAHGRVFFILGMMQHFWYSTDRRRERFVSICADADVQRLTWEAYLHKRLVRARPLAHARIFFKDLAHLVGLARVG